MFLEWVYRNRKQREESCQYFFVSDTFNLDDYQLSK